MRQSSGIRMSWTDLHYVYEAVPFGRNPEGFDLGNFTLDLRQARDQRIHCLHEGLHRCWQRELTTAKGGNNRAHFEWQLRVVVGLLQSVSKWGPS